MARPFAEKLRDRYFLTAYGALTMRSKSAASREEMPMNIRPLIAFLVSASIVSGYSVVVLAQTAPATTPKQAVPKKDAAKKDTPKKDTKQAQPAPAQPASTGSSPTLVVQYGDWGVYVSQTPKTKICYALSQPKDRQPATLKRDPAYFFVSTRPGENVRNEVSIVVGFTLKEGGDATLDIGGANFPFYTKNDGAWVRNAAEEAKLIEAMRKAKDFSVKSTSLRGNPTTDRYSLSGIAQALDRVSQECK